MRRNASMIGTCVTFLHRRTLRTCFGVSKLKSSRRSSFSSLLALQREFRRLHSADGSKYSALNSSSSTLTLVTKGLLSPRLALTELTRLGAHLSPVISVSASYKLHGSETSIAKSRARASQKYTQQ